VELLSQKSQELVIEILDLGELYELDKATYSAC
jgi:hypothetical protein